jgi:hypothetical protein
VTGTVVPLPLHALACSAPPSSLLSEHSPPAAAVVGAARSSREARSMSAPRARPSIATRAPAATAPTVKVPSTRRRSTPRG